MTVKLLYSGQQLWSLTQLVRRINLSKRGCRQRRNNWSWKQKSVVKVKDEKSKKPSQASCEVAKIHKKLSTARFSLYVTKKTDQSYCLLFYWCSFIPNANVLGYQTLQRCTVRVCSHLGGTLELLLSKNRRQQHWSSVLSHNTTCKQIGWFLAAPHYKALPVSVISKINRYWTELTTLQMMLISCLYFVLY